MEIETIILKAFHERSMLERRLKASMQKIRDNTEKYHW